MLTEIPSARHNLVTAPPHMPFFEFLPKSHSASRAVQINKPRHSYLQKKKGSLAVTRTFPTLVMKAPKIPLCNILLCVLRMSWPAITCPEARPDTLSAPWNKIIHTWVKMQIRFGKRRAWQGALCVTDSSRNIALLQNTVSLVRLSHRGETQL
jgi:hypothetical protein